MTRRADRPWQVVLELEPFDDDPDAPLWRCIISHEDEALVITFSNEPEEALDDAIALIRASRVTRRAKRAALRRLLN